VTVLIPLGLYVVALVIRLIAAEQIPFPATEPSAYYADVARSLVGGEGLVSHSIWSYATPPLVVPKPAFELWLPMSSFVSAVPMALLGTSYGVAQLGGALLGSLVAPLTWAIAREAADAQSLDRRRGNAVAIAAGLLACLLSPLLLASVVPDSFIPFTVFVLIAALLVPRVVGIKHGVIMHEPGPRVLPSLGLGLVLGLAYLSRQEVIWLGLTVVLVALWVARTRPRGTRLRDVVGRLWPVVVGGLVVVGPWLIRNYLDLGGAFPGQAVENMFLVQNEDIFAFRDRPDAATYLGQGLSTVLLNPLAAAWDIFLNVILFTAFPVGVVGLVALLGMRRSRALRRPTAVLVLLISSGLTFVTTVLLFPVARLWGTFMHASGPLLVAMIVVSVLGGDALLARISVARRWEKPNVILAPVALIAMAGLLAGFQLVAFATQAQAAKERYDGIVRAIGMVATRDAVEVPATVISDHPMWLADALDRGAIALPDEDLESLLGLVAVFDAPWLIVVDDRGRYPAALLGPEVRTCQAAEPEALTDEAEPAWLFRLDAACTAR
jgi:hypothetical protein